MYVVYICIDFEIHIYYKKSDRHPKQSNARWVLVPNVSLRCCIPEANSIMGIKLCWLFLIEINEWMVWKNNHGNVKMLGNSMSCGMRPKSTIHMQWQHCCNYNPHSLWHSHVKTEQFNIKSSKSLKEAEYAIKVWGKSR